MVLLHDGVFNKYINWIYNGDMSLVGLVRDYWQCGWIYLIPVLACKLSALNMKVDPFFHVFNHIPDYTL